MSAARDTKLRIRAAVTQNGGYEAKALLERFVRAVGIGKVNGPYDYAGRYLGGITKKPRYVVQYQNPRDVARLMNRLGPFLSPGSPKRAKYYELLAEAQREDGGERPS